MTAAASTAPVRVSVVVPVFTPGAGFDELIASLDRQTLSARQFEVLLCDDGSGEPTDSRLAEVARRRPNVRVLTLPHSGWPGTPRNHGIDAARGEYVFFVDQDDWLFDGALKDLCDYADRHGSDVIVGKEVGIGRRIPAGIFRRDIPHAQLGVDPLLEMLTPHKMFRTSFLRQNGIRFPEGRVRLEDHLFVMQAYFAADTISILASRPCYAWVKHPGSASAARIDPETYFPHLERVLDLVDEHTEPGPLRDTLLRHWYRGKILARLEGKRVVRYPAEYRKRFLDVVTPIAQQRFGPGVADGLSFPLRVRSALLRAGRREDLSRFAEFEAGIVCRAEVASARWSRGGRLALTVRVRFLREGREGEDGEGGLVFERVVVGAEVAGADAGGAVAGADAGARETSGADAAASSAKTATLWKPPEELGSDFLSAHARDATRDLRLDRVELTLLEGPHRVERRIPGRGRLKAGRARVRLDPLRVFGRDDASLGGTLVARVRHAGWTFETPLRAEPTVLAEAERSPLLAGRACGLRAAEDGSVEFYRVWPGGRLRDLAARAVRRVPLARARDVAGKVGRRARAVVR
ncbi:glycosyltransferase family 2 protein [Microbacterium sp. zg.Y625]|uniref:glycosyltransferase family 2 protein n=1 Tax=Microbacterium jiangjiandongii TaxID=3049071 RepID=UPI00214BFDFD|nr:MULTISPECIES: glycosyltransferase family A protein [unclassified Microbacterium]MCR2794195.1 glycosyltransferase family 2 protein [Microbacterium sp. zg.Y625]WIM25511.1 glycosyltransferase family A protein [Microbacterium sp. zg-Y625]